jgi:hypothetical protein
MLDTIVGVRRIRRTGRQTGWDIGVSDSTVPDSRWTVVRPTVLTTGPRTGTYRVLVDARDWRNGRIGPMRNAPGRSVVHRGAAA